MDSMFTEHDTDGTLLYVRISSSFNEKIYTKDYQGKIYHRLGGPAVTRGGTKEYWKDGLKHRIGGPAVYNGQGKEYWEYGKLHRLDGPAIISNLALVSEYRTHYIRGVGYTEDEFKRQVARIDAINGAGSLKSLYSL